MAAQQLRDGLSDVTVLRGGIEQWREIRLAGRRSATATFASSPRRPILARPADRALAILFPPFSKSGYSRD